MSPPLNGTASTEEKADRQLAQYREKDRKALQALIDNAASNWEKNQVMEVIARPQKYTAAQIGTSRPSSPCSRRCCSSTPALQAVKPPADGA